MSKPTNLIKPPNSINLSRPKPNNILTLADTIAEKLHVDKSILRTEITKKFPGVTNVNFDPELITKISQLLAADDDIQKYQTKLKNPSELTLNNFNKLKTELGKLQLAILIKKIKKADNCEELLRAFISALNGKLSIVNDILIKSLADPPNQPNNKNLIGNSNKPIITGKAQLVGGGENQYDLIQTNNFSKDLYDKYYLSYVKYKLKNQEIINALITL